jgi:alkanesulfonate monooxygenase SsuD/methylene tetrahydromethanopterin reductase-like flavin-dependent oxidoreductase (luciferase family)
VKYGKGVENGMLTSVGVVPKPLQKPYPPVFLPFASSPNSIRWAAREGITAILPPMHEAYASPLSGKPRGQGTGLLRDVIIADTDEEAMALWEDSGRFSGRAWFEPFGFRRGLMRALEANMKRQPVDWLFCYTYNALAPHGKLMRSTEALWTKVLPKFI